MNYTLKPPPSREPLTSNAMNYMVWRYLQEAGFGMAATWLCREWHRNPDDVLPFAKDVKQSQLVSMVQDALFLDDLRCDGRREEHRYKFGDDQGPEYARPSYDIAGERRPGEISRRASSQLNGLGHGALEVGAVRAARRKSKMITQRSVNGDAMDVDENGYGPSDQASDTQSPAPAVQALPLLDTLTIGESKEVSTEVPRDLLPDTTFLEMPEHVTHSEWSSVAPGPLLVGGSNLVRMFDVAANPNIKVNDWEISVDSDHFDVEAICWLPEGDFAISVSEQTSVQGKGERRRGKLLQINSYGLGYPQILNPLSGVIFALRYNPGSKLLLALSGGLSTVLTIYSISEESEVLCHKELPSSQLFDAVWMNDNKFIACGTNVLQMFEVRDDQIRVTQTHDMHQEWYRIKYDPVCDIAAFVDEEMCCLRQYNIGTEDTRTQSFHSNDIHLSDFAFQPIQNPDSYVSGTPRLLATSTTDGLIQLWDVLNPFTCVHKLGMRGNELAMQLAFSPDGYLLAAAGYDSVTVWKPEAGGEPKALWKCEDQRLWRSRPEDDDETDWVHSLAWDMDGRKLVFALRDQAAIIRFCGVS